MRRLTRHQKRQCILNAGIVGHVDQPFIDDLCPGLGGHVRAQIRRRLADGVDVGRRPRHARRVGQRGAATVKQGGNVAVVAVFGHRPVQLGLIFHPFRQRAFRAFIQHTDQGTDDFEVA